MKVSIVKIEKSGLKYFFDTKDLDVSKGDNVVVETPRGIELGSVISIISIEDEKLTNFYNKYHRKILNWVIYNRDNLNQNPLDNNKNKVYYDLLNSYDKISLQNIEEK